MKTWTKRVLMGILLVGLSSIIYLSQILIFKDAHTTFFYMLQDLAFVPMQILLVTVILDSILSARDKKQKLEKMNMPIGVFFSDAGKDLIKICSRFDKHYSQRRRDLLITGNWDKKKFADVKKKVKEETFKIDSTQGSLNELRDYLVKKRDLLMGLLTNPNLLEHNSFTELLWSVFHLLDELSYREDLSSMSHEDHVHISIDIERAYTTLIYEWICYMEHLKSNYPYLFSLAVRSNPHYDEVENIA
ncbi:MAG: hypothetical protein Q8936_15000 [Bacillota bacterium]|nr:hypothetical protein [Bacillota bacterium]